MRAHARETGGDKPHKTHVRCTQCVPRSSIQASQHNIYTVGVQELYTGLALKLWNSRKPANQQSRIFFKSSGTPFHSLLECQVSKECQLLRQPSSTEPQLRMRESGPRKTVTVAPLRTLHKTYRAGGKKRSTTSNGHHKRQQG